MGVREIIVGILLVGCIAFGYSLKYERRAELRETRLQEKLVKEQLKQDLKTAKQAAQDTLEPFLMAAKNVSGADATLKIRIETGGGNSEHIWVQDFKPTRFIGRKAVEFEGVLGNMPVELPDMSIGDTVDFSRFVIEDWGLLVDSVGYGFFSVRVLLPTLDETEAASMGSFLAPDAVPRDWDAVMQALAPAEPYVEPMDRFMQHLTDLPETWERAMVLVYHVKMETKPNGKTVGYSQATWVDQVTQTKDGKLTGTPVKDDLFNQAFLDVEPLVFTKRSIKDWGFVESGRGYGYQTLRKNQSALTSGQRENLASFFSEDVLPVGW